MTRVMPPRTRTRLIISNRPQASLRKMQDRRVTNTWLQDGKVIVTTKLVRKWKRQTYWVDRIDHGVVGQRENPHCICPHSNLAFKIEILIDNIFKVIF